MLATSSGLCFSPRSTDKSFVSLFAGRVAFFGLELLLLFFQEKSINLNLTFFLDTLGQLFGNFMFCMLQIIRELQILIKKCVEVRRLGQIICPNPQDILRQYMLRYTIVRHIYE